VQVLQLMQKFLNPLKSSDRLNIGLSVKLD